MLERRMQQKKKGPTPEELLEQKRQELLKQQSERMDIAPHLRVSHSHAYVYCCS